MCSQLYKTVKRLLNMNQSFWSSSCQKDYQIIFFYGRYPQKLDERSLINLSFGYCMALIYVDESNVPIKGINREVGEP